MILTRTKVASAARGLGLVVMAGVALVVFGKVVNEHYPVREWLFWVYAKIWTYCILFAVACLSLGTLAMRALRVRPMAVRERLVFTSAAGVLSFFLLVFVAGLFGLLRPWFSVAMPLVAIGAGAPALFRDGKRFVRHVRAARARGVRARPWYFTPITVFGALGLALVYYSILSPRNIAFDSHFYHLGIAQQYATEGGIRRFTDGWVPGALPQLASVLYTWAFTLPGFDMFERIVCAAHVELVIFLFTLASIPVLVRYLAPRAHASVSWAAFFLFPGIFVYDSTLSAAADHIAAFWAVPIYLAFRRAYRTLDTRSCLLLALCLSGGVLTKYQAAMYLMVFPVIALMARAAYLAGRAAYDRYRLKITVPRVRFTQPAIGLGAAAVAGLALTAPHWAKNWIFYGDPLFPFLHRIFEPTQWVPEAGRLFDDWRTSDADRWIPKGTTTEKLNETLEALATFSFNPHDYPNFHGKVPVFGSLFTLSILLLPFLKGAKRIWALAAATHVGVFIWFWTMHQDRYLQLLVPWMVAVTAATIAFAWRSSALGKLSVVALVGFQIVWGADSFLIPAHAMTKKPPITTSNELVGMGYRKQYDQRYNTGGGLFTIGASPELPADARVLLHENNPRLGLWRPVVADAAGWQFFVRYELLESPAALHDRLRAQGVTHIVSRAKKSRGMDSLGGDLRYFDYLGQDAVIVKRFGELTLYTPSATRPTDAVLDDVAYLGCGKLYERGLFKLKDLHFREKQLVVKPRRRKARKRGDTTTLLAEASFAVTDTRCKEKVSGSVLQGFVKIGTRGREELWSRRRSGDHDPVTETPAPEEDGVVEDGVEEHDTQLK